MKTSAIPPFFGAPRGATLSKVRKHAPSALTCAPRLPYSLPFGSPSQAHSPRSPPSRSHRPRISLYGSLRVLSLLIGLFARIISGFSGIVKGSAHGPQSMRMEERAKRPNGQTAKRPNGQTAKRPNGQTAKRLHAFFRRRKGFTARGQIFICGQGHRSPGGA